MSQDSVSAKICGFIMFTLVLAACQKDNSPVNQGPNVSFYALRGNILDKYSAFNAKKLISSSTITGLQSGENILGMDFRPVTGELYALGSNSRIYIINPSTGTATLVGPLTTVPAGGTTAVPLSLSGTSFGFDFNPTVDRIRIVSNTGQNLRANPITAVTLVDLSINPATASVNGVAYTNNDTISTTATELFGLDVSGKRLFKIDPPNNGTLINPLPLNLNIMGDGGFDIAPRNANVTTDIALALYKIDDKPTVFTIDVTTGATKILATYDKGMIYTAIAISPVIEKY